MKKKRDISKPSLAEDIYFYRCLMSFFFTSQAQIYSKNCHLKITILKIFFLLFSFLFFFFRKVYTFIRLWIIILEKVHKRRVKSKLPSSDCYFHLIHFIITSHSILFFYYPHRFSIFVFAYFYLLISSISRP